MSARNALSKALRASPCRSVRRTEPLHLLVRPVLIITTNVISSRRAFTVRSACHASHVNGPANNDTLTVKAREWFDEGTKKWNNDDIHGALECFEKSALTQATGDAYYNIANCQLQAGKHEAAVKAWKKSLELSPDRADAHVNLANVHALRLKDPETAISHYEAALRIEPNDGEIHYNFAVVLDSMGKLQKAIEEYRLAVQNGTTVAEKNLRNAMARLMSKQLKDNGDSGTSDQKAP